MVLVFLVLVIFMSAIIINYSNSSRDPVLRFAEIIEDEKLNRLSLTIYYMDPRVYTYMPLSIDDLTDGTDEDVYRVTISGSDLEEHIDLLKQLVETPLAPVDQGQRLNARIYYVFETRNGDKLFEVAMWGSEGNAFVNGCEVEVNTIFYDILIAFLPDNASEEVQKYSQIRSYTMNLD